MESRPWQRKHGICDTNVGTHYTAEELEFLKAIDRYKRDGRRPHPTWIEVLDVLRSLGWRKHVPPADPQLDQSTPPVADHS